MCLLIWFAYWLLLIWSPKSPLLLSPLIALFVVGGGWRWFHCIPCLSSVRSLLCGRPHACCLHSARDGCDLIPRWLLAFGAFFVAFLGFVARWLPVRQDGLIFVLDDWTAASSHSGH